MMCVLHWKPRALQQVRQRRKGQSLLDALPHSMHDALSPREEGGGDSIGTMACPGARGW